MKLVPTTRRLATALLGAALLSGALAAPASAQPEDVGGTITNKVTKCYLVGIRTDYKNWGSADLHPSDAGFGSLNTNYSYTLALKGTVFKQSIPLTNTFHWWFEPTRFAVKGESAGNSRGNPSGQALGSQVKFRLRSSKTSVNYSLSIPFAVSIGWESSNRTQVITSRTNWENTATTARSGVMVGANSMRGAAGPGVGLDSVSVQSSVIPGADSGAYWTSPPKSWSLTTRYKTGPNRPAVFSGLTETNCSAYTF